MSEEIKVGAEVLAPVEEGYSFRGKMFMVKTKVERLTKTQIIVDGERYKKDGLYRVGDYYKKLDFNLKNDETDKWKEFKEKKGYCYKLPYIEGFGRVSVNAPIEILKKGAELMDELKKVYKSAANYDR